MSQATLISIPAAIGLGAVGTVLVGNGGLVPTFSSSPIISGTVNAQSGYIGNSTGISPTAGNIGEQIRSFIAIGSAVALVSSNPKTVTSITLTPGIWDITSIMSFTTSGGLTIQNLLSGIAIISNTFAGTTSGDNLLNSNAFPAAGSDQSITISAYRVNISTSTTYFMVASAAFTVGSISAYGRISATRVS